MTEFTINDAPDPEAIKEAEGQALIDAMRESEDAAARTLAHFHSEAFKYCPELGIWFAWDGARWARQSSDGENVWEAHLALARALPGGTREEDAHKRRMLSAAGTSAVLRHARNKSDFIVHIDEWDAQPWELNTPAGILDLKTGELRPPDPTRLHTRTTLAAPDADADQSAWLAFLDTTFQGDTEMIDFIQRAFGYACVGEVREHILPVFYGPSGANGKTVTLETISAVLSDYATTCQPGFLLAETREHPTEIAKLAGARLVIASETNDGARFDEARVKILTGGDRLTARFMRQDEFMFDPSHTLFLMTNHRPEVATGGPAFWRRVREVPFDHRVPDDQQDEELKAKLVRDHAGAIMAWLAAGAAAYAKDGLKTPDRVKAATTDYEQSTDSVAGFVGDMLSLGGGDQVKVRVSSVRDAYEQYCKDEGQAEVSAKAFANGLKARFGVGRTKSNGVRFYTNCSLIGGDGE